MHLISAYLDTREWIWLQRSVLTQWRCLAFMPSAPFLFPPVAQESDRGSGLASSHSHSLSPGWIFSSPQIPSAIGYWLLPLPPFLAAPANWNLISWAPALACFCQLDQRTTPPPTPPWAGQVGYCESHQSYPGFVLRFPFQACCFARSRRVNCSWNKYVKFGLFSYAVRVSHLSLVGGVKQPWGGQTLQQLQDYRNMKSPPPSP